MGDQRLSDGRVDGAVRDASRVERHPDRLEQQVADLDRMAGAGIDRGKFGVVAKARACSVEVGDRSLDRAVCACERSGILDVGHTHDCESAPDRELRPPGANPGSVSHAAHRPPGTIGASDCGAPADKLAETIGKSNGMRRC